MAPPRTYKTAFLADVILRYPGPVIATSTKPDIYALTSRGPRPASARCTCSTPSTSAACPPPSAGPRSTDARTRPPPSAAPTRSRSPSRRRASKTARSGPPKPRTTCAATSTPPPWPGYDLRTVAAWVSGADPDVPERILLAAGARQWALTLAELRSEAHKTTATVRMVMSRALAFMADPALAACVLPAPGDGFDIPAFLDDRGTVYLIAEAVSEEAPVAPLFAAMASEIHYVAAQLGQASESRPAGPAAPDGPGRGDPDLPGPAAVLAGRLRRQGHPSRRRRARRSPARRTLGRPRPPGRPGHLLGEGVPARHHRHHHAGSGQHACAGRRRGRSAARTTPPATTWPPRT